MNRSLPADNVTLVIVTCNSATWIAALAEYYRRLGAAALYVLDDRTRDNTEERLRSLGERTVRLSTDFPRVEAMIPKLRQVVETPWILRLDDDECASVELWQWLTTFAPPDGCKMISFPRRWVRFKSLLQLSYSASDRWNWAKSKNGEDRQFRLYDKNTVAYRQDIHTPGYVIEAEAPAPDSCVIYHLDWILRSQSERRAKLSRYDAQLPGAGQEFASYYLPELTDTWDHEGVVTDKALRHLANKFRVARVLRGARNAFRCNGSALPDSPAATK